MWELDHKEGWVLKNWCFQTVVLRKTRKSRLDSEEVKPVNSKGNQSWILIGRTDAEAPILWSPDVKSWLIRKDPDAGKDWRQKGQQRMRWLSSVTDSTDMNLSKPWEIVEDRWACHATVHGVKKSQTGCSNWTRGTFLSLSWHCVLCYSPENWCRVFVSVRLSLSCCAQWTLNQTESEIPEGRFSFVWSLQWVFLGATSSAPRGFGDLASHSHCRHWRYWISEGSQFKILICGGKPEINISMGN